MLLLTYILRRTVKDRKTFSSIFGIGLSPRYLNLKIGKTGKYKGNIYNNNNSNNNTHLNELTRNNNDTLFGTNGTEYACETHLIPANVR